MHSVDSDGVILRLRHAVQVHPATADRLDMRRPWIDQRDVVTKGREVRADITADRTGADKGDALAHSVVSSPKVLSLRVPYRPLGDRPQMNDQGLPRFSDSGGGNAPPMTMLFRCHWHFSHGGAQPHRGVVEHRSSTRGSRIVAGQCIDADAAF